MPLTLDLPIGVPSFDLSDDEIAVVVDLVCQGARDAHAEVTGTLLEVPLTIMVRKAIRKLKRQLGLTNIEIHGEREIEDMSKLDPSLLGRIDITLKFLRQFGDEDDYVAVECKRVGAGKTYSTLNSRYVSDGLIRFVNGQYANSHAYGFMLAYVLALPAKKPLNFIDRKIQKDHGKLAKLRDLDNHPDALSISEGDLVQYTGSPITVRHIFVDMTAAA